MCEAIADNMTKHVRRTLQGHTSQQGLMRWVTLENYTRRRSMANISCMWLQQEAARTKPHACAHSRRAWTESLRRPNDYMMK